MERYKFMEHTADIKFRVFGKRVEELFENTGLAISDFLSKGKKIKSLNQRKLKVSGKDYEEVFYKFIDELIYLFDAKNFIVSKAKVEIREGKKINLNAIVLGDETKNYKNLDSIKSATYSEMYIKKNKKNWEAQAVVDV